MELEKEQVCPYCDYEVEDHLSEWEEGDHDVTCSSCGKEYSVEPIYEFKGFKVQKVCQECFSPEEECYCDISEEDEN